MKGVFRGWHERGKANALQKHVEQATQHILDLSLTSSTHRCGNYLDKFIKRMLISC